MIGTGTKVVIGVGLGWLFLRHVGNNIINQRLFTAALASTDVTEIREAVAFLRSRGDDTAADTLEARADSLEKKRV